MMLGAALAVSLVADAAQTALAAGKDKTKASKKEKSLNE